MVNSRVQNLKDFFKSKNLLYILFVSPALFLLVNRMPYLLILSVMISLVLAVVFFFIKKSITSYHIEVLAILLITYVYFILSFFFSGQRLTDFLSYQFLKNDGNFFFCYILFFVFAVPFLDYKKLLDLFFKFIFFVFSIFSVLGIFEYLTGKSIIILRTDLWGGLVRTDPYGGGKMFFALNFAHNATGSVYGIVSIFALIFFLKERDNRKKLWYFLILFLVLIGLFLTKSRGSYLGFIAAAVIVLWLHFRSWKKFGLSIGAMLLLFIPLLYATGLYKRFVQIADLTGAATLKFDYWEKAWFFFSQSPLFGIGFGRFNDIYNIDRHVFNFDRLKGFPGIIAFSGDRLYYFDTAHAHNSYLQLLTDTGVIGFCLIMIFWILCLIKIIRAYYSINDDFSKKVFLASIGSILFLFIVSVSENYLFVTTLIVPVSMLVSLTLGLYWQESRKARLNTSAST
jgi:O-antigen ligase